MAGEYVVPLRQIAKELSTLNRNVSKLVDILGKEDRQKKLESYFGKGGDADGDCPVYEEREDLQPF